MSRFSVIIPTFPFPNAPYRASLALNITWHSQG